MNRKKHQFETLQKVLWAYNRQKRDCTELLQFLVNLGWDTVILEYDTSCIISNTLHFHVNNEHIRGENAPLICVPIEGEG